MLVICDLFKDKLNMIFKWFDCLLEGKEEEDFIIEELCRNFQMVMEVEYFIILIYLIVLVIIKKNYNNEV